MYGVPPATTIRHRLPNSGISTVTMSYCNRLFTSKVCNGCGCTGWIHRQQLKFCANHARRSKLWKVLLSYTRTMTRTQDDPAMRISPQDKINVVEDAIESLVRQCAISASDDDAISQTTELLDRLRNGCAALLTVRANALANKGKLVDATKEALKAIECQPEYMQGYHVAGDLYLTQGKTQAALTIYERGLRTAVPSEWPLLYKKREAAIMRSNQKINFVEMLPVEVVSQIFIQLANDDRSAILQCLYTSKHWLRFILQKCPELWRNAIVLTGTFDFPHSSLLRFLPCTGDHVQHITFGKVEDRCVERVVAMAKNGCFPSVRGVEIVSSTSMFKQWMPLIVHLRNNLSNLRLMLMDHDVDIVRTTFALDTIIHQCRGLEYLSLETRATVTYQPIETPSPDGYQLLKLTIITPQIDQSVREHLLPQCLRLQVLVIYDFSPEVQNRLDLQQPKRWEVSYRSDLAWESSSNQGTSGLRILQYMTNPITGQHLEPYLTMNQETLETLDLYRIPEIGIETSIFANLGFPLLTKLSLYICEEQLPNVTSMLNRCPVLENVMLSLGGASVSDEFLTSLAVLTQLRDLAISYFHSSSEEFERFFATIASRHQECKLQSITLSSCDDVTDEMLHALADMTTLQSIMLLFLDGASVSGLAAFMQKLQTLPYLKSVDLNTVSNITDDMIIQLAEIDGLLELGLKGLDGITSNGVKAVADRARTLVKGNIYWCENVDSTASQYLYNKLKKYS